MVFGLRFCVESSPTSFILWNSALQKYRFLTWEFHKKNRKKMQAFISKRYFK